MVTGRAAPLWTDAPAQLSIHEGRTLRVPLSITDPEGDEVTVGAAGSPEGLAVTVAEDGSALELHAAHGLSGPATLTVALDDGRGGTSQLEVPVEVVPLRWLPAPAWTPPEGPLAREHGAMIVDAEGRRAFLVGGSGYDPQGVAYDDIWAYDLTTGTWTDLTQAVGQNRPAAAGSRRVAQIAGEPVAYLFGGYAGSGVNDELWRMRFDGDVPTFEPVEQVSPPPARALHAFAHDPVTGRFVVFGGFGDQVFGDAWIGQLDGDRMVWEPLAEGLFPTPRYGFFFGMDETLGRLIVFSGSQGTVSIDAARDTWALDLRSDPPRWELLLEGEVDGVPPGRRNGCHVFDPTGPRLWVFGGTADGATTEPGLFVLDAHPGVNLWTRLDRDGGPPSARAASASSIRSASRSTSASATAAPPSTPTSASSATEPGTQPDAGKRIHSRRPGRAAHRPWRASSAHARAL